MKTLWGVARYELKMQVRGLVFWLIIIVLFGFLFGEVLTEAETRAIYASSSEPIIRPLSDGITIDLSARAQAALTMADFSAYTAWHLADRMGLISALFIGFLSAFVWERDQRWDLLDTLNSRSMTSWQYVLGKFLGVVLTWGIVVLLSVTIGVARIYQQASQYSLPFTWQDFLFPVLGWIGITLLYSTAFVMTISLVLRNGVGALLIHFFYWVYNVARLEMFRVDNGSRFFTYWFFRFDYEMSPDAFVATQRHLSNILLNRLLYIVLTLILLICITVVFDRLRQQGALIHATIELEQQPRGRWKQLFYRR